MQDMEFRTIIAGMQALREKTGTVAMGGNGQFTRLSVLDKIKEEFGEPWHGSLLEDYELGVHVLLEGYKSVSLRSAYVTQEAIPSFKNFIRQRSRWAQGNIQCASYLPKIFRSKNFTMKGFLESCYYLALPFFQILSILISVFFICTTIFLLINNPAETIENMRVDIWWLALVSFGLSILPFIIWGPVYKKKCESRQTWLKSIIYGLGMWFYSFYMYFCLPIAFYRVITKKKGWLKTRHGIEGTTLTAMQEAYHEVETKKKRVNKDEAY